MSKATVTMCETTTGFGKITTLGAIPVETPGSTPVSPIAGLNPEYFSPQSVTSQPALLTRVLSTSKRAIPAFDMDLQNLLNDSNIVHRPAVQRQHTSSTMRGSASPQQQRFSQISSPQTALHMSNAQQYSLLAESINEMQPDIAFDDLNMLDSFVMGDPNQQSRINDYGLDMAFGTGGTGYDNTDWDMGQGMPASTGSLNLFEGFYFGNGSNGS